MTKEKEIRAMISTLARIRPGVETARNHNATGVDDPEQNAGNTLLQNMDIVTSFNPGRLPNEDYRVSLLAAAATLNKGLGGVIALPDELTQSKTYEYYLSRTKDEHSVEAGLNAITRSIMQAQEQNGGTRGELVQDAQGIVSYPPQKEVQAVSR